MRRYVMNLRKWMGALTTIALFTAWPAFVAAQETVIPLEVNWTSRPPAQRTVDLVLLIELLREKGVITNQDLAQLTHPQSSSPSPQGNGRNWTRGEIDAYRHSPINSSNQGDRESFATRRRA